METANQLAAALSSNFTRYRDRLLARVNHFRALRVPSIFDKPLSLASTAQRVLDATESLTSDPGRLIARAHRQPPWRWIDSQRSPTASGSVPLCSTSTTQAPGTAGAAARAPDIASAGPNGLSAAMAAVMAMEESTPWMDPARHRIFPVSLRRHRHHQPRLKPTIPAWRRSAGSTRCASLTRHEPSSPSRCGLGGLQLCCADRLGPD